MEPKSTYKYLPLKSLPFYCPRSSNSLSNNSRSGALGSSKKKASPWSTKKETTESSKETLSPQKNKPNRREESDLEKRKFQMLTYMTNNDLTIIQHVFENLDEGVLDKKMFLLLMIEVLKKHGPPMEMLIKDSNEVYDFIDIDKKNKISFSDFSSFFMMQESGIENLSHAILHFEQKETPSFSSSCILKLYYLEKLDLIAIIEENKRTIKILNAYSLDIVRELSIPKSIVSDVCFMPDFSCFVILSCDRKIYFYSTSKEFELITQFDIPETQISLVYSQTKGLLFSYGLSAKIYGWNAKTILSKNFQKVSGDRDAYTYLIDKDTPFCYQKHISCMIAIDNLGLLATGSNDTYLRLYDLKDLQKEPRVLVGHQKGVKDMTYSKEYQYILSYSYDCDIIIWNAIVGQSLAKLTGHEALILGVSIPTNTDYLITCDARGCTKIWDANTLLQIEDKHPEASNLKCVVFLPKYRRIVFGGRQLSAYEYARPQDQNLTEDFPIRCGVISLKNMEIFIATTYSISVWSLEDGIQVRAMTNIMKADITGMMLDHDERKLFISDQSGRLELFDAVNGRFIKSLTPHQKEISGLLYSDEERMILSISWDKTIRTHLESSLLNKEDLRNGVLKNLYNAHENEILCADISQQSGLLVTGSKEAEIKIWNFQASQLDHELKMFRSDVNCVKFLDPYPLLATSDIEGNICLWTTEPYEQPYKCLVNWKNMFNLQKFSAITAMMFTLHYNKKEDFQESLLYIGDGMGYIRVFDLAELIETMNISPITPDFKIKRKTFNKIEDVDFKGRNASLDRQKLTSRAADGLSSKKDVNIKQVVQWKAHQDTVNQITIINAVDPPIIMTVSSDKMAKFWNFKGENVANLYQGRNYNDSWGIRIKENYVDNSAVGFTKQFKEDIENKYQPEIKKIRNLIGDFTDTYEYEVMAKIDNDDIFKHFSDLENTIAQTIPKSDSKNFVKLKTRKK